MSKQNSSVYNFFFNVGFYSRRAAVNSHAEGVVEKAVEIGKDAKNGLSDGWKDGEYPRLDQQTPVRVVK